jgi:hypothetical protein
MASRATVALKFLRQMGLRPLALFGLYKFGLMTGHYRRAERGLNVERLTFNALHPFPPRELLVQTLGEDGKTSLLKEADEIAAGKFRRFGDELAEIDLTFPQPLEHWTAYEKNVERLTFNVSHNDLKYLGACPFRLGIRPWSRVSSYARRKIRRGFLEIF